MTQQQQVLAVINAVYETIKDMGKDGAPSGILYAGLMAKGCSLNQYNSLIGLLIKAGKVRQAGDVLYATSAFEQAEQEVVKDHAPLLAAL